MEVNDRIVNVILIFQIHDLRSDPWKKMCFFPKICQQFFQFQHLEPFWIGVAHRLHLFNLPRRRYSWNRTWIQHDCTRRRSTVVYCVQLVSRQHTAKRFSEIFQKTSGPSHQELKFNMLRIQGCTYITRYQFTLSKSDGQFQNDGNYDEIVYPKNCKGTVYWFGLQILFQK